VTCGTEQTSKPISLARREGEWVCIRVIVTTDELPVYLPGQGVEKRAVQTTVVSEGGIYQYDLSATRLLIAHTALTPLFHDQSHAVLRAPGR
jgi:hypothetical protein